MSCFKRCTVVGYNQLVPPGCLPFASVLNTSKKEGAVVIKRADGSTFRITPEVEKKSPFDGVKTLANIKQEEILSALRETREEN